MQETKASRRQREKEQRTQEYKVQEPPAYISLTPSVSVHLFTAYYNVYKKKCINVEYYKSKYSRHYFKLKNSRKTNCLSFRFALFDAAQYLSKK